VGAKDIISVKGFKTTWGSPAFKDQSFDYDASVIEMLRDAGAVLITKLTTGELASGDQWSADRRRIREPEQGSSGSSAGPSSATAAAAYFGIGTETSGSILSPSVSAGSPVCVRRRLHQPLRCDGVVVDAGSSRPDLPLCRGLRHRHAGDRPARRPRYERVGHPFNWNPQLVDVRKLRVGILQASFDGGNPDAKRNAEKTLETLRSIGVSQFIPLTVPEAPTNVAGLGVESIVFFDEYARAGKMKEARNGARPNGRLIPAVEYLRSQRVRMMMMMQLADATAKVDVYIVAANNTGGGGEGRGGRGRGTDGAATTTADGAAGARGGDAAPTTGGARDDVPPRPQTPTQRHFTMANLACYPAINIPNGFAANGSPTNAVIYGRPFGEMDVIALAKAYQDAAGFHLKKPTALET
jgi:Asp-tRNA(Asn)/Glu-tRNA(Gln) amidotransferase A subunit family amidase